MQVSDQAFKEKLTIIPDERDGVLFAVRPDEIVSYDPSNERGINRFKNFLKKWPSFYEFIRATFSPGISFNWHISPRAAIFSFFKEEELQSHCIINLGSGIKRIHKEVIQTDIYPLPLVDLVADARKLPFRDSSVDMLVCEAVLEHIAEAHVVIGEMKRILKPGGHIYVSVPFVYPFHASPSDFHRWSLPGLSSEFEGYNIIKSGMRAGPAAALQGILMHFCALPLSFGWYPLYHAWSIIFMFLFSPLKLLDPILAHIPNSTDIGADIYILATKPQ